MIAIFWDHSEEYEEYSYNFLCVCEDQKAALSVLQDYVKLRLDEEIECCKFRLNSLARQVDRAEANRIEISIQKLNQATNSLNSSSTLEECNAIWKANIDSYETFELKEIRVVKTVNEIANNEHRP